MKWLDIAQKVLPETNLKATEEELHHTLYPNETHQEVHMVITEEL